MVGPACSHSFCGAVSAAQRVWRRADAREAIVFAPGGRVGVTRRNRDRSGPWWPNERIFTPYGLNAKQPHIGEMRGRP